VVGSIPLHRALVVPAAQLAVCAGLRRRHRRREHERDKPLRCCILVVDEIGYAEGCLGTIPEHQVHELRGDALLEADERRIDAELDHMLGLCAARELGVQHLVAPGAQARWSVDPFQKIRVAVPGGAQQRALVDDFHAAPHRLAGTVDALLERRALVELGDRAARATQIFEIGALVLDALAGEQVGHGIGERNHDRGCEATEIEGAAVLAPHEIEKIGC
jgi:hypothetical protein